MRYFVTGTDTDVGKTRVCAAMARAMRSAGLHPTIVKLVQTGLPPQAPGDAIEAGRLGGCSAHELVRFPLAADPWNAALHAGSEPLEATDLAARLDAFEDPLIIEGSGGAAAPLNERETLAYVAARASCEAVLVIALRLGCISHALLTLAYLDAHEITVRGAVFVERSAPADDDYRAQVRRALDAHVALLGIIPYDVDAVRSVAHAAKLFAAL